MSNEPESKEPESSDQLDPIDALNAMRDASLKTWNTMRDASLESMRSMRNAGLESWSKMMIELVNSDAYSHATAQWLDNYLTMSHPFQRAIEQTVTQTLTRVNMPVRSDVISLAERLTNVEMRLDDLDAKLDDILRALRSLSPSQRATDTSSSSKAADTPTTRAKAKAKEAH